MVPNCRAYDPAFAYEVAVIMDHGMRSMMERQVDEFYYLTIMNENYAQPTMREGIAADIIKGMYRFDSRGDLNSPKSVRLLGSGAILREVIAAADLLHADFGIASEIFSVTSFSELERDARAVERHNRLNPREQPKTSHLDICLSGNARGDDPGNGPGSASSGAPIIAATDYARAYPQLIASYVRGRFLALGTDGFGRSDSRAALREFFEVERRHIAVAAIAELVRDGRLGKEVLESALLRYELAGAARTAPWNL